MLRGSWFSFDPTKVVRTALQNAASVAGLLLTIEAMVAEKWSDVDLDTRTLLVRRTIDEPEGREASPLPLGREATAALRDLATAGA